MPGLRSKFSIIIKIQVQKGIWSHYAPMHSGSAGANEYDDYDKVEAAKRKLFCYCCGLTFSTLKERSGSSGHRLGLVLCFHGE